MDFATTDSIMYCNRCEEYVVIDVDEKNPKDYKCVKCQSGLVQVLDNWLLKISNFSFISSNN